MPIQLPAGFQPIPATDLIEQQSRLKKVPPQQIPDDEARIPDPIRSKNRMREQIAHHRGLAGTDRVKMAYRLPAAAHTLAMPGIKDLYHPRDPALNQLKYFFAAYETEKPSIDNIQALPEDRQAFYFTRHIGKRGRNLITDEPIEGNDEKGALKTSPHLHTQSQGVRSIRGEAATATIDDYLSVTADAGHFIRKLHTHVIEQLEPKFLATGGEIHLVRPTRDHYAYDATLNFFAFCTQTELAASLNAHELAAAKSENRTPITFTDYKSCVGLSRTARTEATPIGRLVQQPYFTTDDIAPGDKVVIADDHAQAGGCLLTMASALKEAGAQLLGAITLTAHPYCTNLVLNKQVSAHLHKVLGEWDPQGKVLRTLSAMGLPPDTLTNAEAMILIAYATDPYATAGAAASIANFRTIEQHLTLGAKVMEGEHDSLDPILLQVPKSPEEIIEELQTTAAQTRMMVDPNPVTRVEVLDWDCLIVNEKLSNYQLMANAVFIAADNHATAHPVIGQIADAIKPYLGGQGYRAGMPLLCMGKEAFASHAIANPSLWKSHVPVDLIDKLSTIAPHISLSGTEKKQVINILQTEFRRQYKEFTRPDIPAELAEKKMAKQAASDVELPFKNVALEFMPGAQVFLEQQRTPDARLILISNKGDNDLHNEVNKLGIAHFFDVISGVPQVTVDDAVVHLDKKPAPQRLQKAIQELSLGHRNVPMRLWGDQQQDVTQAATLLASGVSDRITGTIVNPAVDESAQPERLEGIEVSYRKSLP
ncbi:MAG: HAD hydrolase-like protein [Pseudomonadota bacterium]